MHSYFNEYHSENDQLIEAIITNVNVDFIEFKDLQNREYFCLALLDSLPVKGKKYKLYVYKALIPWYLNGFEEIEVIKIEKFNEKNIFNDVEYKSSYEKKIAKFLTSLEISFQYEKKTFLFDSKGYERIYYPDFWLLEFGIIIECFGRENDESYDKITEMKKDSYFKENISFISLYAEDMKSGKYKMLIINGIQSILNEKKTKIDRKISQYLQNNLTK